MNLTTCLLVILWPLCTCDLMYLFVVYLCICLLVYWFICLLVYLWRVKSCTQETLNLLTDADDSTDTKTVFNSIFFWGMGFSSFQVFKFPSFQVSKFPIGRGRGREGGGSMIDLETDHVISGSKRGLEKNCIWWRKQTDRQTWRLYDWIGPVWPIQWKYIYRYPKKRKNIMKTSMRKKENNNIKKREHKIISPKLFNVRTTWFWPEVSSPPCLRIAWVP